MEAKNKKDSVGFWRRLAALWIDGFVIYSITKFIIVLLSLIDFRISFGALFIITGAIYSTVMLSAQRQTIGKMLMQITVISRTNVPIDFRYILLREVVGKWGVTISMPMILGQFYGGNNWLPTVFDILIMVPVIVVCLFYYVFTKQMWYEQLSGLAVKRNSPEQKVRTGFYVLMASAVLGIGITSIEYFAKGKVPCRMAAFQNINSTKPYVSFLKEQKTNPVDYVIGLFDKYDMVVLCERAHPEMTQYDFIYDVIRDARFISKVGHIFTEIGSVGMQDYLDKFMLTDSLNETEIHNRILHIMHNTDWPAWTKYNFYNHLNRLYHLNQTLPVEKRVQHHFTDAAWNWNTITTKDKYREWEINNRRNRDERMANKIIKEMNSLSKSATNPPKCLVIMNYRHAMDFTDRLPDVERQNTYEFLKDAFGNRAANVFINTQISDIFAPVAGGVWDAAFEKIGNKPLGFDFQGSPFGTDYFDLFPFGVLFKRRIKFERPVTDGSLRFRDVFTGYVFTHPTKEQFWQQNTPGYYDEFEDEYIRRSALVSDEAKENAIRDIQLARSGSAEQTKRPNELKIETYTELFFYCFAGIGLVIGFVGYMFRGRKKIMDIGN